MPALPRPLLLLVLGVVAAAVSAGGVLFGVDSLGAVSGATAFVLLAGHVVRAGAGHVFGAGLLLLTAAAGSRLWHPVDPAPTPTFAGASKLSWTVPSLDGERLTGVLLLLGVTALEVAVYLLPRGGRSRWPVVAAVALGLVPVAVAASLLVQKIAGSRWPSPADPWPLLIIVLPWLLATVLAATSAAAGARRARSRLILTAGALALEAAIVADMLRAADVWSLVTLVSAPPGGGAFLTLGSLVWAEEPTLADRLQDPHPGAALVVALALAGAALLALGAGRAAPGRSAAQGE